MTVKFDQQTSLDELAGIAHMSKRSFIRAFLAATGERTGHADENHQRGIAPTPGKTWSLWAVRSGDWKLVGEKARVSLFDLGKDVS